MTKLNGMMWRDSQFAHMYRTRTLITNSRKALLANRVKSLKDGGSTTDEEKLVEKAEAARIGGLAEKLSTDFWVQMGYLPLTMHWCVSLSRRSRSVLIVVCVAGPSNRVFFPTPFTLEFSVRSLRSLV